jgi:hypothetical protein
MDDELKLGYHRLGRRFEDPAEMFALAAGVWALLVILFAIAVVLSSWQWLGLILVGIAALFLLRDRLATLAGRWRQGPIRLERPGRPAHPD